MVDREARRKAALLVCRLRDGINTNDDFESEWPTSPRDRALKAVAVLPWAAYSDNYTHKLAGRHALTEDGRKQVDRCVRFLESDLEYEWPRTRPYAKPGVPVAALLLSLGLFLPFHVLLRRRYAEQEAAGESAVWPFLRRSDHDREQY